MFTLHGTYSNVVLSKPFPELVSFRIYRDNDVVYSIWNRIFPFQIDPRGKMHYLLREFLYIERVQSSRANNHLRMGELGSDQLYNNQHPVTLPFKAYFFYVLRTTLTMNDVRTKYSNQGI